MRHSPAIAVLLIALLACSCAPHSTVTTYFGKTPRAWPESVEKAKLVGVYSCCDTAWIYEMHLEDDGSFAIVSIWHNGLKTEVELSGIWRLAGRTVTVEYQTNRSKTERMNLDLVSVDGRLSLLEPPFRPVFRRAYVRTETPLTNRNENQPNLK
jgi:hypothetical protein